MLDDPTYLDMSSRFLYMNDFPEARPALLQILGKVDYQIASAILDRCRELQKQVGHYYYQ